MTRYWYQAALGERYLSPDTGSRFARTALRKCDPRQIGRYRLPARLGAAGMGIVYPGVAENGRLVAVKVIRPELADNPDFRARFGSVGYLAPEQVMGQAGPAADIFACAVTVAYAASGQPPFGTGGTDA